MDPDNKNLITYRKPTINDGAEIYELIKQSPPLDLNSSYLYFLQATHFADTCVLAVQNEEIIGFISAYFRPNEKDSLFVWQVAVAEKARGQGLGRQLLYRLVKNQERRPTVTEICCTISPSNKASQSLFKSFAEQYRLTMSVETFLEEKHFGNLGHEAEELYSLRAPYNQNLINTLF